jgi:hypothetical protein
MRSSGGRGADAWMVLVPVVALLVAGSMSAGGLNAALLHLESTIRHTFNAGLAFITKLF